MKRFRIFESLCIGILFLVIGVVDLPNYGPNWDEPGHFVRGQAFLQFFLTGKKDYQNLSLRESTRRSFYQNDDFNYTYFEKKFDEGKIPISGAGHPPLSDILASLFNRIFYQVFNIVGDVESYHLYSVTLSAILVSVLYYFVSSLYGSFAGIVSVLSLVLSPLFLGESRFNIKDVPEAVFYTLTILAFYQGIIRNNRKWIIASSFFAGLAFSTKLNIVFALVSLVIWSILFFRKRPRLISAFVVYPLLPAILYFGSWPILWKDPIGRFLYNLHYYETIGTVGVSYPEFITIFGINTYAIQWILFSTPLVMLIFTAFGLFSVSLRVKKNAFSVLILLWFLMPIIRVSLPRTVIYGGVRQIMEYIPAMAILSGIGANWIVTTFSYQKGRVLFFLRLFVLLAFIPITIKIIQMHPNESIYFNPFIGGLRGAAARNIPGWGNSLGSTYRQGVRWLNIHAEKGARLGFVYELRSNIPDIDLRPDIQLLDDTRSAIGRKGEYIIGVTHEGMQENSYHRKYLERFLNPVYALNVDGVSVLKIWKNDFAHSKPEYQKQEELLESPVVSIKDGNMIVDLKEQSRVTKIVVHYPNSSTCTPPTKGYFQYSLDGGHWENETADFSRFPLAKWFTTQPAPGVLQFLFAAEPARFIKLVILDKNSCLLQDPIRTEVSII